MRPLLSIVVPTKDRYEFLFYLLKLVDSFNSSEIEVIIQDNTSENAEVLSFLKTELKNVDIFKYFHTKEQISVSENSTKAIINSTGEYVCFIGDDDGVTRRIVECVHWMKKNNINILKSSLAIYKWPCFRSPRVYNISASALSDKYNYNYRLENNRKNLEKLLANGMNGLTYMPKVYNGIVKRDTLDSIYNVCGTFFPGVSPDMANAVSLALIEENYCYLSAPIIIGGHSRHLGGDTDRYKKNWGPLEEQKFIAKEDIDKWSPLVPKVWAATTVWPQSAISAIEAFDATDYLRKINYTRVHALFVNENPDIKEMAYGVSANKMKLKLLSSYLKYKRLFIGALHVLDYHLFGRCNGLYVHSGINNIIEAEKYFYEQSKKLDFDSLKNV